jgi:hypothetical protein
MTLEPYGPDRLDVLSLQVLDICLNLRRISQVCREEQLGNIALNDKKALEWIGKLEQWVYKAQAETERSVTKNRAVRRAQQAIAAKR